MNKNKVVFILSGSETSDIEPPFSCIPPIHPDMIQVKAERIMSAHNAEIAIYRGLLQRAIETRIDDYWLKDVRKVLQGECDKIT